MRKIISISLALCMLFALTTTFATGVSAAIATPGNIEFSFELYEVTGDGEVLVTDLKTLEPGDTVKLYQVMNGYTESNYGTLIRRINTYIDYNTTALQTTLYTNNMLNTGIDVVPDFYCSDYATSKTYYNNKTANKTYIKNQFITASSTATLSFATTDDAYVGSFEFTVLDGIADIEELTFSYVREANFTGSANVTGASIYTGVSDNVLFAQSKSLAAPIINSLTITEAADVPAPVLGADVALTGKTDAGYQYSVTLNNTTEGASYKAYVKDAVYGWTQVKAYDDLTTFDIVVENPCDPFEIEILEEDANIGVVETPTYSKTLAELGQISLGDVTVNPTNIGEAATISAKVNVPENKTATYTVYFDDSYETVTGAVTDGQFVAAATSTRVGTYAANITVVVDGEDYNVATKRITYTVVDAAVAEKPYFNGEELVVVGNVAGEGTNLTIPGIINGDSATTISRAVGEYGEASYSTATSLINIAKPGVYSVYTDIKDANGATADTVYKRLRVLRAENNVTITSVTGLTEAADVDTTYNVAVTAENATEYLFVRREADTYVVVQDWSTDNTWDWTPARKGIYEIHCYAKGEGAGAYEALNITTVNVGGVTATEPAYTITGTTAGATSTIAVTNPVEGAEYCFEIYDDYSDKNIRSGYSADTSYNFVVDKARTYTINVYVKAAVNSGAYDAVATGSQAFTY